jgi:hypothetical protein
MKAPTKRELYARIAALSRRVAELEDDLGINTVADVYVPFTAFKTIPVGTTIRVPLPKRFEPK